MSLHSGSDPRLQPPQQADRQRLYRIVQRQVPGARVIDDAQFGIERRPPGDGLTLADKWAGGPRTYLGMMSEGFPNLFFIAGPGSPSVLSNMVLSIEQHVEWIADLLGTMRLNAESVVSADRDAEDRWVDRLNAVAAKTLYMKGNSWYLGANVPGKPRVFMPFIEGVGAYRKICDEVVANDYHGVRRL